MASFDREGSWVGWSQFSCEDSLTDSLVSLFGNKDLSLTVARFVGLVGLGGWVGGWVDC